MFRLFLGALLCVASACVMAAARDAEILILGTYHFSSPGKDLHNLRVDDVLAPARQKELQAVTEALARFSPTRVAVEWPANVVDERYPKFLAGTLPESRNEVVQIGFRLAKARGLDRVYGLDVPGEFPFEAVQSWAKAHDRMPDIDALMTGGEKETTLLTQMQEKSSIGGVLRYLNEPASIARNHSFYPAMLRMGAGEEQPGVALLSAWYTRNLAICARLLQLAQPADRVAVFFGQGHVYLLHQCIAESRGVRLVDALTYLTE